jgi:hypothetical protein
MYASAALPSFATLATPNKHPLTPSYMPTLATHAHEVVLSGGATLRFVVPASAVELAPEKLPRFDVSGLPGARIAVRRGFLDDTGSNVFVACVEAPSDRWAPGMEDVVFGVAGGVAHRAMTERLTLERWDVGSIVSQDKHFEQKLSGSATREGSFVKLLGKHVLGFEGPQREVVLCSTICDEPRDHGGCSNIVDRSSLDGLVTAPQPSLLVQTVFLAAERPWDAVGITSVVGLLLVGFVLAKRPRPVS